MTATPKIASSAYDVAVADLLRLGHELHAPPSHKFDLAHMRALLGALGNPERRFASVLIAGTNGKGSTAATLHSILRSAGFRAGLYTSPHLVRANERIAVDGDEISDPEFAEIHGRVEQAAQRLVKSGELPWHPSFFEMLTAMAFEYFASSGVEIAVLEVGMGGRLDATNVVDPCVAVIADIALDHQNFLGNTLTEIAREKAGIIRPGGVVVTLPQHPEANDVIGNTILEREARGVSAVEYVPILTPKGTFDSRGESPESRPPSPESRVPSTGKQTDLETRSPKLETSYELSVLGEQITVASPLVGRHQLRNIALAIAAAIELKQFGFEVTPAQIEAGIRDTKWPGRFQMLPASGSRPEIVLDVAHNPAGAWALRSALSQYYEGRPIIFIFGAMRDKAISEIAQILFPLAECVIATQAATPRAASPQQISEAAAVVGAEVICEGSVAAALERARALTPKMAQSATPVVVITGSIYIVGEALEQLALGR